MDRGYGAEDMRRRRHQLKTRPKSWDRAHPPDQHSDTGHSPAKHQSTSSGLLHPKELLCLAVRLFFIMRSIICSTIHAIVIVFVKSSTANFSTLTSTSINRLNSRPASNWSSKIYILSCCACYSPNKFKVPTVE